VKAWRLLDALRAMQSTIAQAAIEINRTAKTALRALASRF